MGNTSRTHPPLLSRHLTLQNFRNINFLLDFSTFDALDGSWLMAHGQGRPGEAHGSWPGAGRALGTQKRAGPGPDLGRAFGTTNEVQFQMRKFIIN